MHIIIFIFIDMETWHVYDYDPEREEYLRKQKEEYIRNKKPWTLFGTKTLVICMSIIDVLLIIFMLIVATCDMAVCGALMGFAILYRVFLYIGVIILIFCIFRLWLYFNQYKNKYWLIFSIVLLVIWVIPSLMFSGVLPFPRF